MFDVRHVPEGMRMEHPQNAHHWTEQALAELGLKQSRFFASRATLTEGFRQRQLQSLKRAIRKFEPQIIDALYRDLHKSPVESYMTEIGGVLGEIREAQKHLKKWMKAERCNTPLALQPAHSRLHKEPLGRCLILSPWNYPFLLNLAPLIAALAAGNVIVLKPSELASNVSRVIFDLITDTFPAELVQVVEGQVDTSTLLLKQKWDLIFFTGSTSVGKVVAEAAAKNLTPCILELGGKSPCIVSEHADLSLAARRIIWGKFLNAGQTCVAPDYVFAAQPIFEKLVKALSTEIHRCYGSNPIEHPDLPKVINASHFKRLQSLIDPDHVKLGGRSDPVRLQIEPTLLTGIGIDHPLMKQEIFGPLLPILSYQSLEDVQNYLTAQEKPLALYLFSRNKAEQHQIVNNMSYGGGCINDVVIHTGNGALPFGGVGASGMGAYHGKYGFDSFSHRKSVFYGGTFIDPRFRYAPWTKWKEKIFRFILR